MVYLNQTILYSLYIAICTIRQNKNKSDNWLMKRLLGVSQTCKIRDTYHKHKHEKIMYQTIKRKQ